jgi:cytosine/uracil/thiamine/allantoin permease
MEGVMEVAMGLSMCVVLFGLIVMLSGMAWAMFDGRLWSNPGETVMHWGLGILFLGLMIMLVILLVAAVQCTLTTTCQL